MSDGYLPPGYCAEEQERIRIAEEQKYINRTIALQNSMMMLQCRWTNQVCPIQPPNQPDQNSEAASSENDDAEESTSVVHESESLKKFIAVVLPSEPNEIDRAKIVHKLDRYFKRADQNYMRSPEFSEFLDRRTERLLRDPVCLHMVLKDVKKCLLAHKMETGSSQDSEDEMSSSDENASEKSPQANSLESDNLNDADLEDMDDEERKQEMVNKLTSFLTKLHGRIKELEESEVDFSDEEGSNYLKMQRYRERFSEVYEKLCSYTNKPFNEIRVGGVKKINFSDTNNLELNRAIEKWLNKTGQFPDYSDVNNVMIELNQSHNLKLTEEEIKIKAQQIFESIGNKLQRRRHFDLWDSLSSFLSTEIDPAARNPELQSVLKRNYDLGIQKEKELLKYYAERQEEEQLQPREVPDEEANCSPGESDDEDEEEIDFVENMFGSKISTDDDDDDDDEDSDEDDEDSDEDDEDSDEDDDDDDDDTDDSSSDNDEDDENVEDNEDEAGGRSNETGIDESEHNSFRFPESRTRNESLNKMIIKLKARVENNDPQSSSVSNDYCGHISDVGSKGIDSYVCVNSEKNETVGKNIETMLVKDGNMVGAIPNKQDTEDNLVACKSENFMKRKNENLNENDNDNVNLLPCKKFLEEKEMTETNNFEETEIINKSDSDSDCEIIEIVSNKEGETSTALSLKRNAYQVNYAFTNNNFNYNTVLSDNALKKRQCFTSNYKNTKNQKPAHDLPPNELTDVKNIANKNALHRENKVRKSKNILNKQNSLNSITCQTSKDSDLKNNELAISTSTNSINCSLHQEKSGGNMKSQKEVNKTSQNNDLQQGSNNETAAPPNGGSSSGGNGQDNSENNGNKKPSDRQTQTEDNPENEDKEEDEEEDADTSEEKQAETPKVTRATTRLFSRTNQQEQKVSTAAVFTQTLPQSEKVAPVRRNSLGKQLEKPSGSGITQRKEPLNSTPTAKSPRGRAPPVRKRKANQNGGIQGTPQQGKSNVFTFHFQKGPATLKKPNVNKALKTASSSKDAVEMSQAAKKKRSTPVKPVQTDEEIVKNFLERSHPSISITTPKKRAVQKEPPPSIREALETLSRLKGISATIVKGSSKRKTDEEVTIIGESPNTRVNKISKQQKTPALSATATMPPPAATATMPPPAATATMPPPVATATMPPPVATATMPPPVATATMPPPVATATKSFQPFLPKIVTVQGNFQGFDDMVDESMTAQDDLHQNYVQNPQASLVNVSGIKTDYSERFYNPQAHLATVSSTTSNYNEHFYSLQAPPVATVARSANTFQENLYGSRDIAASISGRASTFQENLYGSRTIAASISGRASTFQENLYSSQASAASISGRASTFQENLYGSQASAASISGSASTYEGNCTGTVDGMPAPRLRNVRPRSGPTPKKTQNIEYIILD